MGTVNHGQQLGGQVGCVVNAAIHAHAAARRIQMGGIAREEDTADAKLVDAALVYAVGIDVENLGIARIGMNVCEPVTGWRARTCVAAAG